MFQHPLFKLVETAASLE